MGPAAWEMFGGQREKRGSYTAEVSMYNKR